MKGEGLHICLVDDDNIYQFIAKKMFQSINPSNRLTIFSNGQEAIDYFSKNCNCTENLPDLIFLDINMPVMNGWEFLQAFGGLVGTLCKIAAIYMVSSSVNESDLQKVKQYASVIDYLFKPVTKDRLQEILVTCPVSVK